jgi:hypothetical protein
MTNFRDKTPGSSWATDFNFKSKGTAIYLEAQFFSVDVKEK